MFQKAIFGTPPLFLSCLATPDLKHLPIGISLTLDPLLINIIVTTAKIRLVEKGDG
jgi:hypothetical protein